MKICAVILAVVLVAGGILFPKPAVAEGEPAVMDKKWHLEFTPYLWMAGITDNVTINGNQRNIDISFDDLKDNLHMLFSFMTVAEYENMVFWAQYDLVNLGNDLATVDTVFLQGGGGWKFKGPFEGSTISALWGVDYLYVDTTLNLPGGQVSGDTNIVDPAFFLRPSFPLFKEKFANCLRFNPTMMVGGGGDSNLIYELEPMLQYDVHKIALRAGYRTLHYKYAFGNNSSFSGDFAGPIVGLGIKF